MKPEPVGLVTNYPPAQPGVNPRNWTFERGKLWVKDLRQRSRLTSDKALNLDASFGEVRRQTAGLLAEAMGSEDSRLVLKRFESGRRCFAAWIDAKVAAYCWVSRFAECIGEIEHEIHLLPDEAYIWDCATLAQYRNRGVYTGLLSYITSVLQNDGVGSVWIGSSLDNIPSMRGFSRAGFSPVATLSYVRLFHFSLMCVIGVPDAISTRVKAARRILNSNWPHVWGSLAFGDSRNYPFKTADYHSTCSDGTI